ncbi:SoxR reducing system RseC family protein [Candidatus Enterovibrio escicola]|uniref:Sigma factor RpoE regulatory protein RseC n=1 Tax=Candidatus Enterovibrio escicola TaxID=1927127 RepID=A0A2A5T6L5_9GAMM|nr:SoxR reducing system RseC family protein [Candidatus Enterovibrio escacola]PCS23794.1 Sigma factor RpoE regulatory protein RseC [Candidatus Enterovibrio escacola]
MMTTLAEVTGSGEGYITVICHQKPNCEDCLSVNHCGIVGQKFLEKVLDIRVLALTPVRAGSLVEIGFEEQTILKSIMIVYIVPLLFMIAGAFFGQYLTTRVAGGEGTVILSSLLASGVGVAIARHFFRRLEQKVEVTPTLIRVFDIPLAESFLINSVTEDSE